MWMALHSHSLSHHARMRAHTRIHLQVEVGLLRVAVLVACGLARHRCHLCTYEAAPESNIRDFRHPGSMNDMHHAVCCAVCVCVYAVCHSHSHRCVM